MTSKGGGWRRAYPIAEPYLLDLLLSSPEVELCPLPLSLAGKLCVEFLRVPVANLYRAVETHTEDCACKHPLLANAYLPCRKKRPPGRKINKTPPPQDTGKQPCTIAETREAISSSTGPRTTRSDAVVAPNASSPHTPTSG